MMAMGVQIGTPVKATENALGILDALEAVDDLKEATHEVSYSQFRSDGKYIMFLEPLDGVEMRAWQLTIEEGWNGDD